MLESIAYIGAGILGVQQKSEKACFIIGIILVAVCGISAIMNIVEGSILPAIIGLVVPVIYLIGAIQLKRSVENEQAQASATTNE